MDSELLIDFGKKQVETDWNVIVDGVMGGLSKGRTEVTKKGVLFTGEISLRNNGGFASFRSRYSSYDLSEYKQLEIRLKSKGISFAFTLETNRYFYQPNFKQHITTESEDWETITLDLDSFKAYRLGRPLGYKLSQENKAKIIRMGFISDEKREGTFELEIDYIKFK